MKAFSFKVSDDEDNLIRTNARSQHLTLSEYLRRKAIGKSKTPARPKLIRCPRTGAMVFAPLENQEPLTTESVRNLLSDFP